MSQSDPQSPPPAPDRAVWEGVLKRLAIWGLFLLALYLTRDFFFVAFMTFMFSYLALTVVGWSMQRLSGDRERAWLRRLMTAGAFAGGLLLLVGAGSLIAPEMLAQGQRVAGWLSHVSPESELVRFLAKYIGPYEFKYRYGSPQDPEYQRGLKAFVETGGRHAKEYLEFPSLEAWVEGGFSYKFNDSQRARIRQRRAQEGTFSKDFDEWFLAKKLPELKEQAQQLASGNAAAAGSSLASLAKSAASTPGNDLLEQARHDPAALAVLKKEWIRDVSSYALPSPSMPSPYQAQLHKYFNERKKTKPGLMPYTFEQFVSLQAARRQGPQAFSEAFEKIKPATHEETEAELRADFQAAKEHELFQDWWANSGTARFLRAQLESSGTGSADLAKRLLASFLNIPIDLGTALLLSFFICIDFPKLQRGVRQLRDTWLRDAYDEIAPALSRLSHLVGRSMQAQGLIALCNATMIFIALNLLGVEHELALSGAVFVLCLVPTLGAIFAWVLVTAFALLQPDGGAALALKTSGAFLGVVLVESFVLSPRILGRMMELHPVMIIAILPVAQYFFGVWGLILATPVAVYILHVVIFGRELPGTKPTPIAVEVGLPRSPTASAAPRST